MRYALKLLDSYLENMDITHHELLANIGKQSSPSLITLRIQDISVPFPNAPGRGTEHDQPQSFFQTPASVQQCALAHCGQQRNPCWPRSHPHGGFHGGEWTDFFRSKVRGM